MTSLKIFALILLSSSVSNAQTDAKNNCTLQYKVEDIPKSVKREIRHYYRERMVLVNPKQKFQATDVVMGRRLKERRLIFWTICDSKFFLAYEHGGYGYHEHLILLDLNEGSWRVERNIFIGKSRTLDKVKKALARQTSVTFDHF